MDSTIIYFLSMLARIIYLCENNAPILLLLPAFKGFITELTARKAVCDAYVQKLQGKTISNTILGVELKREISIYFSACCATVSSYGYSVKDAVLMDFGKYHEYDFFQMKTEELKDFLATILKAVDDNKTALIPFGITPAFILSLIALQTRLIEFNVSKNLIDLHKNTKEALEAEIKEIRLLFKHNIDSTSVMLQFDNNEFYKAFQSARKVPSHHMHNTIPIPAEATTGNLSIVLINKITGLPEPDVTLTILAINFIIKSDINGLIQKPELVPAEYTATLTGENINQIDFTFVIKVGETTDLGFILETITPQL